MKRISLLAFALLFTTLSVFAGSFEGVVKQAYYDGARQAEYMVTWFIKGDQLAMKMEVGDDYAWFIPQLDKETMLVYSDQTAEGQNFYSELPASDILSEMGDYAEFTARKSAATSQVSDMETAQLRLSGSGVFGTVEYASQIDVDPAVLVTFFKTHFELTALAKAGVKGFPLASDIKSADGGIISSLQTISVEQVSVEESVFSVPSGYVSDKSLQK